MHGVSRSTYFIIYMWLSLFILAPTEPRTFNATPLAQAITLSWLEPLPTNGEILRYHVCYQKTHDDHDSQVSEGEKCETTTAETLQFNSLGRIIFLSGDMLTVTG